MTGPRPSPGRALDRLMQRTQAYLDAADLLSGSGRTVCRLGFMCGVAALYCAAEPEEFISMPEWGWPRVPAQRAR